MSLPSISATELAAQRDELTVILDVREPHEVAIAAIDGALTIPMGEIAQRWEELKQLDQPIYCLCHLGMRSAMVVEFLISRGIEACNIIGGIEAWATEVDTDLPRY